MHERGFCTRQLAGYYDARTSYSPCPPFVAERTPNQKRQDQLLYMRGLVRAHVKKPMSRDQVRYMIVRTAEKTRANHTFLTLSSLLLQRLSHTPSTSCLRVLKARLLEMQRGRFESEIVFVAGTIKCCNIYSYAFRNYVSPPLTSHQPSAPCFATAGSFWREPRVVSESKTRFLRRLSSKQLKMICVFFPALSQVWKRTLEVATV